MLPVTDIRRYAVRPDGNSPSRNPTVYRQVQRKGEITSLKKDQPGRAAREGNETPSKDGEGGISISVRIEAKTGIVDR